MSNKPDVIHFSAIMEPHVAEVHTMPMRDLEPDEVLIKMEAINICTTDYQHWDGLRNHQGFPMAGGHEWSGVIIEKGADVNDYFEIGDRVCTMPGYCGVCPVCRRGNTSDCQNRPAPKPTPGAPEGMRGSMAFADYHIAPQDRLIKVGRDVPAAEAGMLEPVSTAVQCVKKAGIKPLETVVVIGAGTMGLVNVQVARAFGARVIVTEVDPKKIAHAKEMGGCEVVDSANTDPVEEVKRLTGGVGADVVIAAVGHTAAYKQGMQMLRQLRGRFIVFPAGYPKPELDIDPNEMHYRMMDVIGTFASTSADWVDAADLLTYGLIDVKWSLEGKVFPLGQIQDAFAAAATPGAYRITVDLTKL
ncbi:zinc-binding dehydrogenase [Eubacteriales bacterium OttesenSCG-928-M02]|nr:zinc-binding dehydrogenase [Eubacteriales bacterium OttesenSCG-928-M02]